METPHNGHPRRDHEHSDVRIGGVVKFLLILIASGVVIQFVLVGMWRFFGQTVGPADAQSAFGGPRELPPQPRLQVHPRADLQSYLRSEQEKLNSYGTDPATGAARIPIDRAIDLVAERGLPYRRQASPGAAPSAVRTPPFGFVPAAGPEGQNPAATRAPGTPGLKPLQPGSERTDRERSAPNAPRR
jgi:hypothetical protein